MWGKRGEERKRRREEEEGGRKDRGRESERGKEEERCEDLAHPAARASDSFESQGVGVGRGTCRRQQKER